MSDNIFAEAKAENTDAVVIAEKEGVYLIGNDIEFSVNIAVNDQDIASFTLEGGCNDDLALEFTHGGITADGVYGDYDLIIYNDSISPEIISFFTEYKNIFITGDSDGENGYDVKYSAAGTDVYDSSLLNENEDCTCICHATAFHRLIWKILRHLSLRRWKGITMKYFLLPLVMN